MNIQELTAKEASIESKMPKGGYFEERDEYLKKNGLYEEWRKVFIQYSQLAKEGELEALKRAIFFCWYQCAEPNSLSGLLGLDEIHIHDVLTEAEKLSGSNELDSELKFMLPFYYQVCNWYFERFEGLHYLLEASLQNNALWEAEAPKYDWKNRGIMGDYWSSKGL